jgi:uncharacterized membrane protein YccC
MHSAIKTNGGKMLDQVPTPKLQSWLANISKNKILLLLAGALVLTIFLVPSSNRTSKELVVCSVTILLVKAESRPQPRSVIVLGVVLCAATILGVIGKAELGHVCDWIAVALMIPLVFSKWLFVQGNPVPQS